MTLPRRMNSGGRTGVTLFAFANLENIYRSGIHYVAFDNRRDLGIQGTVMCRTDAKSSLKDENDVEVSLRIFTLYVDRSSSLNENTEIKAKQNGTGIVYTNISFQDELAIAEKYNRSEIINDVNYEVDFIV